MTVLTNGAEFHPPALYLVCIRFLVHMWTSVNKRHINFPPKTEHVLPWICDQQKQEVVLFIYFVTYAIQRKIRLSPATCGGFIWFVIKFQNIMTGG